MSAILKRAGGYTTDAFVEGAYLVHNKTAEEKKKEEMGPNYLFSIGFSRVWKFPIHNIIKQLRDDFVLTWLRVRMSYRKFPKF